MSTLTQFCTNSERCLYTNPCNEIRTLILFASILIFVSKNPTTLAKNCDCSCLHTLLNLNLLSMEKLSKDIEDVVVSKLRHGLSTHIVAKELGISQSCVQRIKAEWLQGLHYSPVGRPRVLTSRQERTCVRAMTMGG
jgi:hypothetical protein